MKSMFISSLVVTITIINFITINAGITRRDLSWENNAAYGCDFNNNDLKNQQMQRDGCAAACATTEGCSHFTWTSWNGGTCWMKKGEISKDHAFQTDDHTMFCGVINDRKTTCDSNRVLSGVLATHHGATESGACALPSASYAVINPVALGNIPSLDYLKFRPELCGQILEVDCGNGPTNVIVTNSNLGGGLDLYHSSWNRLTNNKPPGEQHCNVRLTSLNAFTFDEPRCYYKPGTDFGNEHYRNVGLLNTKGRIVTKAMINEHVGEHRGDNPYFAFNFGPISTDKDVVFTYEDGTTHSVSLEDCQYLGSEQTWS